MNTLDLRSNPFFRKGVSTWTLLLCLIIAVLGSYHSACALTPESEPASSATLINSPKNVLVLFSYHRAEWSDNIQKGIESVFAPYQNVNFFFEYMDTKRLKTKEYLETLRKIYTEKYAKAHIDVIFCVDNNALELLVENARTLFPGIPVVFCGINDYKPALHAARPDVTGVVEYGDFTDTLKIAFKARPNAKKLYIVSDHTETGEINTRELLAILSTVAPNIEAVLTDQMSYEELSTALQTADPQQVAFFVSFWKDGIGRNIEPWQLDTIFKKAAIPIFGRSEWMINRGMVGGKCVTGFAQGEAAARIALKILGGTPVSVLPVDTNSPNQYLFDHRMMQHYLLDEAIFPKESIGFNCPEPFYRVKKPVGITILVFSALLLAALVFLSINIHRRKRAEDALLRNEKDLRESQRVAHVGSWRLDVATNQVVWSEELYNIYGFDPSLPPPPYTEHMKLFTPESWERLSTSLAHTRETGIPYTLELETVRKDGSNGWMWVKGEADVDSAGKTIELWGAAQDITDRKQSEEEKRKVLEYAAEQSKLSLIGQVAGKMAHDFNNILMAIMGNAQLAIMKCDDRQIKEKLKHIIEFSERGKDITSHLISYSKDQVPKQIYFKIEDKIDLILKMYEKELKGIEVSKNYKPGIPKLLADPGMIQDALANLFQNSIHAMSKAETPRLKLKAYSQDDKVYFEIEDNGCGIPKEHQDSIFTPSFTLKGSHDKTGSYKLGIKGTGYGMSNVKKCIVEKHKGDISLESEIGKGTKITIALKIIKNHLSPDEKKEVVKSQIYDKRRILLVEDEVAIADVQYQILTKEPFNHVVSTTVNGQMAIDVFDRNKFDVVSLDYMLPGNINGLDVYNHIRKNDGDIPVMFISGNIEFLESIKKLKEKDPNLEHLSKPVSNLEYVHKINELIRRTIKTII